jgi:hypothetical protein
MQMLNTDDASSISSLPECHHFDSITCSTDFDEQAIVLAMDRELPEDPLCFMSVFNQCPSSHELSVCELFSQENICHNYSFTEPTEEVPMSHSTPTTLLMSHYIQDHPST